MVLRDTLLTHWNAGPEFLSILKVGDVPHNLALLAPRPILFVGSIPAPCEWVQDVYAACGASANVKAIQSVAEWAQL